uniref:Uncharacterized protein n=1 Tax=Oryza brachyantha TaxID=4533 RepID=J3MMZ7_ORYBR
MFFPDTMGCRLFLQTGASCCLQMQSISLLFSLKKQLFRSLCCRPLRCRPQMSSQLLQCKRVVP